MKRVNFLLLNRNPTRVMTFMYSDSEQMHIYDFDNVMNVQLLKCSVNLNILIAFTHLHLITSHQERQRAPEHKITN